MHDLGLIIYYSDDEGLRDIVVLNPEWLTKAISYVLEDEATRQAGGILDHARLRQIWGDRAGYESRYHPYFLRLMEKFDISYRIEGDETRSLVAQLVPLQRPPLPWQLDSAPSAGIRTLTLVCRMSEPAPGLIPWLTVRHHRDSTGSYWRRGVFLRHRIAAYGSEALIELRGSTELVVQVRAPSPDMYFNVLRDSIEDLITRRWPGLAYRLYIPCPGRQLTGHHARAHSRSTGCYGSAKAGQVTARAWTAQPHLTSQPCSPGSPLRPRRWPPTPAGQQPTGRSKSRPESRHHQRPRAGRADRRHQSGACTRSSAPKSPTAPACSPSLPFVPTGIKRALIHQDHYRLTLWCEHPGYEHPWEPAAYNLDPPKEWLTQIAPYAVLVFRTLQLIVPLAGAVAIAALPTAQQGSAQTHLADHAGRRRRPARHGGDTSRKTASTENYGTADRSRRRGFAGHPGHHLRARPTARLRRAASRPDTSRRPALGLREPLPRLRPRPARSSIAKPSPREMRGQVTSRSWTPNERTGGGHPLRCPPASRPDPQGMAGEGLMYGQLREFRHSSGVPPGSRS